MDDLLKAIRESPLSYLPEISLSALCRFREGYSERCRMEDRPHYWSVPFNRFGAWLRKKFKMGGPSAIELAEPIVLSFSSSQHDAFNRYFELLDEFCRLDPKEIEPAPELTRTLAESDSPVETFAALAKDEKTLWSGSDLISALHKPTIDRPKPKKDFIEIIRPDLFPTDSARRLSNQKFSSFCAFVMGDERAHHDLQLASEDLRVAFSGFQRWVETKKNQALPRRWFNIIFYYSASGECGSGQGSAFFLFCRWLEQYAQSIGKPDLFNDIERRSQL